MARIPRVTQKIFAGSAVNNGVFGSGQDGTKVTTNDLATLMSKPAWLLGWAAAVLGGQKFPPLEELQSSLFVHSQQVAYLLQQGISEYDAGTTYFIGNICVKAGTTELYSSLTDNNTGNALSDASKWKALVDLGAGYARSGANADISTLSIITDLFTPGAGNILNLHSDQYIGHVNRAGSAFVKAKFLPGTTTNDGVTFDQFPTSTAANYVAVKLPGGVVIQAFSVAFGGAPGGQTVTFPVAHTTRAFVTGVADSGASVNSDIVEVSAITATNFNLFMGSGGAPQAGTAYCVSVGI